MALSIPAWLEIPPANALCKVQELLLRAMVMTTSEDAKIYNSLSAVNDMLGDFVGALVDQQHYGSVLGRDLGVTWVAVKEKDALCAMVEINKAQQRAIRRKDKQEYEELKEVITMLSEMIEYHSTIKAKGKGKRGMSDTADAASESCTKYARC